MDYKLVMNTAILAGEIMLKSGAETYRVEDTMCHILRTSGAKNVDAVVMMTGIIASLDDENMESLTVVRRVQERGTNLNCIMEVNEISRKYCAGEITLEEAWESLGKVGGRQYPSWLFNLATALAPFGFAPMLGGGILETIMAGIVGAVLALITSIGKRLKMNGFILDIIASIGIAVSAILIHRIVPAVDENVVIASAILPLVPGVAVATAVRDTLQGDYISGGARVMEAFLKAIGIALGIGVGMTVAGRLF